MTGEETNHAEEGTNEFKIDVLYKQIISRKIISISPFAHFIEKSVRIFLILSFSFFIIIFLHT